MNGIKLVIQALFYAAIGQIAIMTGYLILVNLGAL